MAKLAGDAHVYAPDGTVYAPGDDLPDDLKHLSDEADTSGEDASASAGTGDPDQDAKIESLTVPQLRKELDKVGVAYDETDRKDTLVQKVKLARA